MEDSWALILEVLNFHHSVSYNFWFEKLKIVQGIFLRPPNIRSWFQEKCISSQACSEWQRQLRSLKLNSVHSPTPPILMEVVLMEVTYRMPRFSFLLKFTDHFYRCSAFGDPVIKWTDQWTQRTDCLYLSNRDVHQQTSGEFIHCEFVLCNLLWDKCLNDSEYPH